MAYQDKEFIAIKMVAVEGGNDDWTVYCGPADWEDERVASNGNKMPQEVGAYFFPRWNYRLNWRPQMITFHCGHSPEDYGVEVEDGDLICGCCKVTLTEQDKTAIDLIIALDQALRERKHVGIV